MKPYVPNIHLGKPPPLVSLTFLGLFLCNYTAWACYMLHSCERSGCLASQLCRVQKTRPVICSTSIHSFPAGSRKLSSSAVSPRGTFLLRPPSRSTTDSPLPRNNSTVVTVLAKTETRRSQIYFLRNFVPVYKTLRPRCQPLPTTPPPQPQRPTLPSTPK